MDLKYAIEKCPKLMALAVDENQIQNINDFAYLHGSPELERIEIYGNPVCSIPDYRKKIFSLLPDLEIIDGEDVFGYQESISSSDQNS